MSIWSIRVKNLRSCGSSYRGLVGNKRYLGVLCILLRHIFGWRILARYASGDTLRLTNLDHGITDREGLERKAYIRI